MIQTIDNVFVQILFLEFCVRITPSLHFYIDLSQEEKSGKKIQRLSAKFSFKFNLDLFWA